MLTVTTSWSVPAGVADITPAAVIAFLHPAEGRYPSQGVGEDDGMAVEAVVRQWHPEEGWGVLDAEQTPGGCWAHFGHIAISGYRQLHAGQVVMLEWEAGEQDGYAYRAVRCWPAGTDPVDPVDVGDSAAYTSTLTLRFDDPEGAAAQAWRTGRARGVS